MEGAAGDDNAAFADLVGLGPKGAVPFGEIAWPRLVADFDDAVIPSQLHAAAELYFIYQNEREGVFRVAEVLRRLYRDGRMRIQRGPGARGLYLLEKWQPLRYGPRDRHVAYMRVFNYGRAPRPAGAIINVNFHYPARRADVGAGAVFPRPHHRRGDPRRAGARAAALRYARDRAAARNRPALRRSTARATATSSR